MRKLRVVGISSTVLIMFGLGACGGGSSEPAAGTLKIPINAIECTLASPDGLPTNPGGVGRPTGAHIAWGRNRLHFPPLAVQQGQPVIFQFQKILKPENIAYQIKAQGSNSYQLDYPALLTLSYAHCSDTERTNFSGKNLRIFVIDPANNTQGTAIPSLHDKVNHRVSGIVDHFSGYVIGAG